MDLSNIGRTNLSNLGSAQTSALARKALGGVKPALDVSSDPSAPALPANGVGNSLRPRLERMQTHIDKRLAEIRNDKATTPEQKAAFDAVQQKFHAMMNRFDRIVRDGDSNGVFDHVIGHLRDAIDAALSANGKTAQSSSSVADSTAPTTSQNTTAGSVDTLA